MARKIASFTRSRCTAVIEHRSKLWAAVELKPEERKKRRRKQPRTAVLCKGERGEPEEKREQRGKERPQREGKGRGERRGEEEQEKEGEDINGATCLRDTVHAESCWKAFQRECRGGAKESDSH